MGYRIIVSALICLSALAGCANAPDPSQPPQVTRSVPLYPGETPELRGMINASAERQGVPASLIHRVVQRESDYHPRARNGPYYGLMQILPQTARTMGHDGPPRALLNPVTNLRYAVRYLKGAYMVADGDEAQAVRWYARGYYYAAKRKCLLVATGLNDHETARHCD